MSEQTATAIGRPLRVSTDSRRRPEESLGLRFPGALVAFNWTWIKLSPQSRIRRLHIHRATRLAIEAANRRDYDAAFGFFHPDFEMNPPPDMVVLGSFPASLRGREERIRLEERWIDDWGELRYEPEEVIDLTDRVLVIGRMTGSGASSGIGIDREWADLFTISRGQVIREQVFFDRAEALEAAGLSQ